MMTSETETLLRVFCEEQSFDVGQVVRRINNALLLEERGLQLLMKAQKVEEGCGEWLLRIDDHKTRKEAALRLYCIYMGREFVQPIGLNKKFRNLLEDQLKEMQRIRN